jgi:hypothetical protein
MKNIVEVYQDGIREASRITKISTRQASIRAGFNQNQLNRFLSGDTDIKLGTLVKLCRDGFGLNMETVYNLGKEEL